MTPLTRRTFLAGSIAGSALTATQAAAGAAESPAPQKKAEGDRVVRIATVQLSNVVEGDTVEAVKAYHRAAIERTARDAAARDADIICWHENAATYQVKAPAEDRSAWEDALDGPTVKWAGALARELKVNLALPMTGHYDGGRRNLVIFIDRAGKVNTVYAKVHLTYGERQAGLIPGDRWPVAELDFGRVGAIVCHDMSFPESVRCLALGGAEVVFWPTHWSGWGDRLNYAVIESRAIDNALWLAPVGLAPPPGRAWRPGMNIARSGVIDPFGEYVASAGMTGGMAVAEIDLDKPRIAHSFSIGGDHDFRSWMLADRRPDTYGAICDPDLRPKPPV